MPRPDRYAACLLVLMACSFWHRPVVDGRRRRVSRAMRVVVHAHEHTIVCARVRLLALDRLTYTHVSSSRVPHQAVQVRQA